MRVESRKKLSIEEPWSELTSSPNLSCSLNDDVWWTSSASCQDFYPCIYARGRSLINNTLCPMMHWACESICHRGNIGTNLSSREGEGLNPADEKRNVRRKMDMQVER